MGSRPAEPETIRAECETDSGVHHWDQITQAAARKTRAEDCAAADRLAPAQPGHCCTINDPAGNSGSESHARSATGDGRKAGQAEECCRCTQLSRFRVDVGSPGAC